MPTPNNNKRGFTMRQLLLSCLLCLCGLAQAATGVFPDSTFNNLDHGLYWFG